MLNAVKSAFGGKKLLLLPLLFFCFAKLNAQNLIQNYSFEDTIACPTGMNQVENASGWINLRSSPDYFNTCNQDTNVVSVPEHWGDYQCPANGNAYLGIIPLAVGISNYREFFGTQLLNPLAIGQKYYVSFKVNLSNQSVCACNKLGALFTTYIPSLDTFGALPLKNFATIYTDSIITDTINWITITKSFVADSNYSFVLLGNFFDDQNTDTLRLIIPSVGCNPYYYIEDVCVSSDPMTCIIPDGKNTCDSNVSLKEISLQNNFCIYPNPANSKIIIDLNEPKEFSFSLFNSMGIRVKFIAETFQRNEMDMSDLPQGIYFIQINTENASSTTKKITLIK